jgi:predicted ATPase
LTLVGLSLLAKSYTDLGQLDDARRLIDEATTAVETTKERWYEAEMNRMVGEIALLSPEPDTANAEGYFQRALAVARKPRRYGTRRRGSVIPLAQCSVSEC